MRYYIDTCVWIDFVEDRTDDDFMIRCIENEDIILYSYPLEKEILKFINPSKLNMLYAILSSKDIITTYQSQKRTNLKHSAYLTRGIYRLPTHCMPF